MGLRRRFLLAPASFLLAVAFAATLAPAARAGFGARSFEAGTCRNDTCTYASVKGNSGEAYTQAAGHPPWGITTFELNSHSVAPVGSAVAQEPEGGALKRIRVDVPRGLAGDPEALPQCSRGTFDAGGCAAATQVGTTEMTAYAYVSAESLPTILEKLPLGLGELPIGKGTLPGTVGVDLPISGKVFNLTPEPGLPLLFGIEVAEDAPIVSPVRLFLEGHVAWSSDYHEYFEIVGVPPEVEVAGGIKSPLKVLKSKLNFNGRAGEGNFLTMPSICSSSVEARLELESWSGQTSVTHTHTPIGVSGCGAVPSAASVSVIPQTAAPDEPDGASVPVKVPQNVGPEQINTSDVQTASVTLPEGLTLNPSAARGLGTCAPAQIGIGTTSPVTCPAASRIGTVSIETDLPAHSLTGGVYLGDPSGGPIKGPPFTIYIDAESVYGVSLRLAGLVQPNPTTGRLNATFSENPELPFSELALTMKGGPQAPLANPITCANEPSEWDFTPYSQGAPAARGANPFAIVGCASPLPFAWSQSTASAPGRAGAFGNTSYTFNLARPHAQQYLAHLATTLPPGLVGAIPAVPRCHEPQAAHGDCPADSKIGSANVTVGVGPEPYAFSGPVFLTDAYGGDPFGLSIPIAAHAGPFEFGTIVTRAGVGVNPSSARVVVTSSLPTVVEGVPLRLRTLSVAVNHPNFLYAPTNCGKLASESLLTSTFGTNNLVSSPFSVRECNKLAFTPKLSVETNSHVTKADGAGLKVTITQPPHQANIASVVTALPLAVSTRQSTLNQACPEATYAANPHSCPPGSEVGNASAVTPTLPVTLSGPAYLVSHGGAAFPDLDVLLEGDGVRVILVGHTRIHDGITSTSFDTVPDVPISRFVLSLPTGPHSALTAYGVNLCAKALLMPTTITSQSGIQLKRNTHLAVAGCRKGKAKTHARRLLRILRTRTAAHAVIVKVKASAAGVIIASGRYLKTTERKVRSAMTVSITVPLSSRGRAALSRGRSLKIPLRLTLRPAKRGEHPSSVTAMVALRR